MQNYVIDDILTNSQIGSSAVAVRYGYSAKSGGGPTLELFNGSDIVPVSRAAAVVGLRLAARAAASDSGVGPQTAAEALFASLTQSHSIN